MSYSSLAFSSDTLPKLEPFLGLQATSSTSKIRVALHTQRITDIVKLGKLVTTSKIGGRGTHLGGISGGEPAAPYAYSDLHVIFATSPTLIFLDMPDHVTQRW
jgi:hypothetical protein